MAIKEFNKKLKQRKGALGMKGFLEKLVVKGAGKLGTLVGIPPEVSEAIAQGTMQAGKEDLAPDDYAWLTNEEQGQIEKIKKEERDDNFKKVMGTLKLGRAKKWQKGLQDGGKFANDEELLKAFDEHQMKLLSEKGLGGIKELTGIDLSGVGKSVGNLYQKGKDAYGVAGQIAKTFDGSQNPLVLNRLFNAIDQRTEKFQQNNPNVKKGMTFLQRYLQQ
jgi:hypothetical protein